MTREQCGASGHLWVDVLVGLARCSRCGAESFDIDAPPIVLDEACWGEDWVPTEGATMTTLERIEAALYHLSEHEGDGTPKQPDTKAARRELLAAKIELMGRGEGTSMS